jgi:hypothetical protein
LVFSESLAPSPLAQNATVSLEDGFKNPPNSARPRVWWHWMNGNITKEGITLDLEWMNRVGIGGFQNFAASLTTPKLVDKRLVYMTPEWKDAFLYATTLADQLGLEEAIAGSPGCSESGGPWVKPSHGMKKVVWSETRIQGGEAFPRLAAAPSRSGRTVPERSSFRFSRSDQRAAAEGRSILLRRHCRSRLPCARRPRSSRVAAAEDHVQQRDSRSACTHGRRSGQDHATAQSARGPAGLDPV